jgi:ribosomal protein L16 Arg81 hydroxylase
LIVSQNVRGKRDEVREMLSKQSIMMTDAEFQLLWQSLDVDDNGEVDLPDIRDALGANLLPADNAGFSTNIIIQNEAVRLDKCENRNFTYALSCKQNISMR